jgi:hypothetical protein
MIFVEPADLVQDAVGRGCRLRGFAHPTLRADAP